MLKFAVLDFLDDREFKNVTPKTLQSYRDILKQFEDFCLEHDVINVEDITTSIMKRYILHYQKKGNNATTTSSKLQRIRAFLNYMIECDVIKNNPAKKMQKAREMEITYNHTEKFPSFDILLSAKEVFLKLEELPYY
ncbi:tyrosine-type recombinase/integrase [Bacillus sp. NPDC077411]|uniref:tyrosine-type recombinase/integrase n=1 Tax=Bacillus sp. NPDC077411 TaxID=3363947 RepID=UPI0037CB89F7